MNQLLKCTIKSMSIIIQLNGFFLYKNTDSSANTYARFSRKLLNQKTNTSILFQILFKLKTQLKRVLKALKKS